MITGILIGIGSIVLLSFIVCMFDRETREDLLSVIQTVGALPALPIILLALTLARKWYRVRPVSPGTFRRIAATTEIHGWSISRQGRSVLVVTRAKPTQNSEDQP